MIYRAGYQRYLDIKHVQVCNDLKNWWNNKKLNASAVVAETREDETDPYVSDELNFIFLVSGVQRPLPVQFYSLKYERQ